MRNFPKQRIPYSDKVKNDFKWAKDTINHLLLNYGLNTSVVNANHSEYERKLSNYQLYNNQLNQKDFERDCNAMGLEVGQFQDKIQPYNKTYNKIQVLLGDELRRPFNFRTVLINPDGIKAKLAVRDNMMRQYVESKIQEVIKSFSPFAQSQEEVDQMAQEAMPPEEIDKYMKTTYLEAREILASKILQYLIKDLAIVDIKNDAFKHALIAGEELIYVGEKNDQPSLEILNPLGVFYHKSPETKWIQNALYAGYRTYLTTGEVLDRYGLHMSKEQLERVNKRYEGFMGYRDDIPGKLMDYNHDNEKLFYDTVHPSIEGSYSQPDTTDWLVQHVEWKSQKEVGFLTFINEYGDEETQMVSEDFIIPSNADNYTEVKEFGRKVKYYTWTDQAGTPYKLMWSWVPEIWTGTRIGQDMFVMIGPKQHQFRNADDPYDVKLGYHGLVYNSMNAMPVSVMDRMKPFQYLYFIVMHKLKKLIALDQGKVFHFDSSMVDPMIGLEKTLYYLKEMNLDIFNSLQNADMPGQNQRGKVTSSSDMSNMQHVLNYVQLLNSIDQQISDVAGVSRQREGQISPTEAVSNAQANVQMSAIITEVYFHAHSKLWEQVLTSLIQMTQALWKDKSVVKQFVLDDLSLAVLEVMKGDLDNASFGVYLTDSSKETQMFDALKAISDGLLNTNRATFSDLITLYEANSAEELKRQIRASEDAANQREQQAQESQQQAQQAMLQAEQEFELEKQARQFEHDILIAEIESFKFQKDQDVNNDGVPDQLQLAKLQSDVALKNRKLDLEEKRLEFDKVRTKEDQKIKRQKPTSK